MASEVCGAGHPRNSSVECQRPFDHEGTHHDYEAGLSWSDDRG